MTCLTLIQSVCLRVGLDSPNSAIGNTDRQIKQVVELANEAGQECARRYPWQVILAVGNFTTLAAESQGTVESIAPGLDYIINDTIWNRTLRRPVFGPQTPQAREQQKAFAINGPWSSYRLIGGLLSMYPTPTAGQDCYFEYISKNWVTKSTSGTSATWTNDADTPLLDNNLLVLDTIWRFKQQKGLDYAEDFSKAERALLDLAARDGGKDTISMVGTKYDIWPGVIVPAGSWSL
jgi:hypothetical protein